MGCCKIDQLRRSLNVAIRGWVSPAPTASLDVDFVRVEMPCGISIAWQRLCIVKAVRGTLDNMDVEGRTCRSRRNEWQASDGAIRVT
jgi:hypothetical protein